MKRIIIALLTLFFGVSAPAQLQIVLDTLINEACPGASNGEIQITVSGGTSPYTYDWSRPPLSFKKQDIKNIPSGLYSLTVTDKLGLQKDTFFIVLSGEPIAVSLDISTYGDYQISCNGCSDGWIEVTNGTGNGSFIDWTYLWTDPKGFTSGGFTVTNLTAGIYSLEITDLAGCPWMGNIELTQPAGPVYSDTITVFDTLAVHDTVTVYDTVNLYDTIHIQFQDTVTVWDTIHVSDTVYKFTEVKEEIDLADPVSAETLTILNYGDYLKTDKILKSAVIYNILGSKIGQLELTDYIQVSEFEPGIYLFIFELNTGAIFRKKIYIE
jgi:hypothetical protein